MEPSVTEHHIKIGRIHYANLFPIFYALEKYADCSAYDFIDGAPSALNRLLRDGKIDISPSSSIEYLRNKDRYTMLEGHSISSFGPIGSILLFSKKPLENLNGLTILTSSQSETSVVLLDVLLNKFYSVECRLKTSNEPLSRALEFYPAYLLIGDDALKAAAGCKLQGSSKKSSIAIPHKPFLHIYDLADLWYKNTGLPFVFALWIARKDICIVEPMLFEKFRKNLDVAKDKALKNLMAIAGEYDFKDMTPENELVSYWQGISYDLNEEHKKGLALFRKYAEELRLL